MEVRLNPASSQRTPTRCAKKERLHDARRDRESGSRRLNLFESVLDQRVVIFFRKITLNELRGDSKRKVDRFLSNLNKRSVGLLLNLALGVSDDSVSLRSRFRAKLLLQLHRVDTTCGDDGIGVDSSLGHDLA